MDEMKIKPFLIHMPMYMYIHVYVLSWGFLGPVGPILDVLIVSTWHRSCMSYQSCMYIVHCSSYMQSIGAAHSSSFKGNVWCPSSYINIYMNRRFFVDNLTVRCNLPTVKLSTKIFVVLYTPTATESDVTSHIHMYECLAMTDCSTLIRYMYPPEAYWVMYMHVYHCWWNSCGECRGQQYSICMYTGTCTCMYMYV